MNITHITSDEDNSYTVLKNNKIKDFSPALKSFSLLILNNGNRFQRSVIFDKFSKIGFKEIISIESENNGYNLESLLARYENFKFIITKNYKMSVGEKINLGFLESDSKFVFVINSNMEIPSFSSRLIEKIEHSKILCICPIIKNSKGDTIPSMTLLKKIKLKIETFNRVPEEDGQVSLFPYDFIGIYDREKFLDIGGFDKDIYSEFYQKMDFGFRAFMFGDSIRFNTSFKVSFLNDENRNIEDTTEDKDYKRFLLKNLLVKYDGEKGFLPFYSIFSYLLNKPGFGIINSIKEFMQERKHIKNIAEKYKIDSNSFIKEWERIE